MQWTVQEDENEIDALKAELSQLQSAEEIASLRQHEQLRHDKTRQSINEFKKTMLDEANKISLHLEKALNALLSKARIMNSDVGDISDIEFRRSDEESLKRALESSSDENPKPAKRRRVGSKETDEEQEDSEEDSEEDSDCEMLQVAGRKRMVRPGLLTCQKAKEKNSNSLTVGGAPPAKRVRPCQKPEVIPRVQKHRAIDSQDSEYEPDLKFKRKKHTKQRKTKFNPRKPSRTVFQHDFRRSLRETPNRTDQRKSACLWM